MGHPKNKYERRRRDKIARDLHSRKYHPRTVEPRQAEDDSWKEDLQDYYGRSRTPSDDVLPEVSDDD